MKVKPLLQSVDSNNFLTQYLTACGINNVKKYVQANKNSFSNPWDYPNMTKAVKRLNLAAVNKEKIGILVDSDADGYCSASMLYNFLTNICDQQNLIYFIHTGKQHGLNQSEEENIVQQIINNNIDLLFIPDAGTNNVKEAKILYKENNIDIICLDHHEITEINDYSIIVNHHLGNNLNTGLSGAGVTYTFIRACSEKYDIELGYNYLDLVATSLVTDVCDMTSPENYAFIKLGFNNLTNSMLKKMFEVFNTRGNNPIGVAWGVGPKINSVCRSDNMEVKIALFEAMIGEYDIDEAIAFLKEEHKQQTNIVKQAVKQLSNNLDLTHKVIIGYIEENNKNYTGLIANKLTGEYNKPTLILRELDENTFSGSMRSPVDLAHKINESNLASCQGHESASGILLKKENVNDLINWFDDLNLSFNSIKNVTCCIKPKDINLKLCQKCENNMLLWNGSDNGKIPQPKFYIVFESKPEDVTVFVKRTKTVKFSFGNVNILKFMAKQEDVELLQNNKCKVEAIITLETNEYNGNITPQAKIEEWEINVNNKTTEEDWMDLF